MMKCKHVPSLVLVYTGGGSSNAAFEKSIKTSPQPAIPTDTAVRSSQRLIQSSGGTFSRETREGIEPLGGAAPQARVHWCFDVAVSGRFNLLTPWEGTSFSMGA